MKYYVELIIESDGEDAFHGYCLFLKGLHTGGSTPNETLRNLGDAISAYMESIMTHEPYKLDWYER